MLQLPFGFATPQVAYTLPQVKDLPSWRDVKRICLDVETKDPQLRTLGPGVRRPGNAMVGVGFAIEDGPAYYLPIRHEGGDNMPVEHVLAYLRDQAKDFTGTIVGANLGYDLDWLWEEKIESPNAAWYRDVQVADPLINELYDRYDLDTIAARHGLPGKDEDVLRRYAAAYGVDPKKELYKLPGRAVAQYAAQDVRLPLQVLRRQERLIEEEDIQQIFDLESQVTPALVRVRRRGVRVSLERLRKIETWATTQANEHLARVHQLCGAQVALRDVWNAKVYAGALEKAGFKVPLTAGGAKAKPQPSVTGDLLDRCGDVGKSLGRARDYAKLLQFAEQVHTFQINGRVHCVFHQLRNTKEDGEAKGARFGRMSSEKFNFQQQPVRDDEFGDMWRSIYVADEGADGWACNDWSQQEPRIGVHYAELLGLRGAKDFADRYRADPALDIHQMLTDVIADPDLPRKIVKNFVNGLLYGMGDAKLCHSCKWGTQWTVRNGKSIEVPNPESQAKIDKFTSAVPWLRQLVREAANQAKRVGHVWTVLRRKCHFPKDGQGNYDWTHKAFSRIGQGGAADQMKATLVAADREGIPVQAVVHDEFDFSYSGLEQPLRLRELQMNVVKFRVPMKVDVEVGPDWGHLSKVKVNA